MTPRAIIFDFDGVIADSETAAGHALAESLTAIGLPTTFAQSQATYYGHNGVATQRLIEARLGHPLPADFHEQHSKVSQRWFAQGFEPVPGAAAFLARTTHLPRAIASSSSTTYIRWALEKFGLSSHFGDQIHSAEGMERGKPHPDIYLIAAQAMGVDSADCMAIEDSPTGATAAVAAGMHVLGLCAALHIEDKQAHAESLRAVGVHGVAFEFAEIALA